MADDWVDVPSAPAAQNNDGWQDVPAVGATAMAQEPQQTPDEMLQTPYSQRIAQWSANHLKQGDYLSAGVGLVSTMLASGPEAIASVMDKARKAAFGGGLTPEEETEAGFTGAMLTIGGGADFRPPKPAIPVMKAFDDNITMPLAQRAAGEIAPAEMAQARQLGVVGPDMPENINLVELAKQAEETPAQQAERAVPSSLGAAATPDAMKGEIPPREPLADYEARFKQWISKIDAPDDVRDVIDKAARENDFFPMARDGEVPASHVSAVAEAAGLDPKDIDRGGLTTRFDSDAKVRAVVQALRHTTNDFLDASKKLAADPTEENAAAHLEAQERQRYVTEYTLGFRGDSGRTLNAWKDLLRETERSRAVSEIQSQETEGKIPKGFTDVVNAAGELRSNLSNPKAGKLGLQKLIDAADNLANSPRTKGKPTEPLPPDLAGLVAQSKETLRKLRGSAEESPKKGDAELDAFRTELAKLDKGEGNLGNATDAARRFVEATKKEPKESQPGEPQERGRLAGAARRFVMAADREPQIAKAPASAEMQSLMETARQAVGRIKGGHQREEFEIFRRAIEAKDYDGAIASAKRLVEAESKRAPNSVKPPVEYDQAMNAARRVIRAAEDHASGAKEKLPPDLESLLNDAKQAANALTSQKANKLSRLVDAAEKQAANMLKQKAVSKPIEALPPEWQALVDKADLVTKRFGGIAKGQEAAMMLARSGRTAAEQAELARSVAGLTPNQVARVLERVRKNPDPHWLFWGIQQGLISGLITHTKYAVVNVAQSFVDRVVAPEMAAIIGKARGQDTSLMAPLRAVPAMVRSVPDALEGFRQAFKTGMRVPLESELKLAERGEVNPEAAGAQVPYGSQGKPNFGIWKRVASEQTLDKAARIIGIPGRSANALHTFFKVLNERSSLASRAFEMAEKEKPGSDKFWDRYQYHLDNPTDENLRGAVEDGYSGTFMEKLGDQSEKAARLIRNTPFKWLVFFTHIPFNMIRAGIKNSPLALLNMLGETKMGAALKGELGAPAQNLAFAHVGIGTAVSAYFIDKALSGRVNGDYPTDQKEKNRWKDLGIQPNSMRIGDQWVSLDRLGPLGMVARIGANYAHIFQHYDGKDEDAMMKATFALVLGTAKVLGDDVGFETLRNIVDVMENPREAARFAAWQLSSYAMPISFITQAASFNDPFMREANTLINGFKYHLPGLRETLPIKRDPVYGEPVHNPGYHAILRSAPVNNDPVKAELDRLQYYPAAPERHIGGQKLTDAQYDKYEATAGPLAKMALNALVTSPGWQNIPDGIKTDTMKSVIKASRQRAAMAMQLDNGGELLKQAHQARLDHILGPSR